MLPSDYPDDFAHTGLLDVWFRDVPWRIQNEVMGVNPKLRCIRNPATSIFVVVLKLNPEDKTQHYPFFGVAVLHGWQPLVETKPGFPVEFVYQLCEGMRASARYYDEHYGPTKASMDAQIRVDQKNAENARVRAMLDSTRQANEAMRSFLNAKMGSSMWQGMSPRRRLAMFKGAATEFHAQRARDEARAKGEFSLVVAK